MGEICNGRFASVQCKVVTLFVNQRLTSLTANRLTSRLLAVLKQSAAAAASVRQAQVENAMTGAGPQKTADLNYIEFGSSGPPLLLLHGLNESLAGYRLAIAVLHPRLHVLALDMRGHGRSPWSQPYRVQDYGSDVIDFIQTRIGSATLLAGHSLGGLVAAYVASRRPDLISGLILEEPPLFTAQMPTLRQTSFYPLFLQARQLLQAHQDSAGTAEDMEALVREWPVGSGEDKSSTLLELFGSGYVSRLALELHQTDPRTLDPVLEGTLFEGFDPDRDLARIACPTHLIAGGYEQGGALRAQDVERAISLIPTSSHVVWAELGHDIHTVRPGAYAQELLRLAATVAPLA